MSSSMHTTGPTKDDDDGDDFHSRSADRSFGFRRWSRNLSAQRHRELNRLNQIERRRQFLELKSQNDLFDQMSASVNGPNEVKKIPHKVVDNSDAITTTCSGQNKHSTIALNEPRDLIDHTPRGETDLQTIKSDSNKQTQSSSQQTQHHRALDEHSHKLEGLDRLRVTSLSSPEDKFRAEKGNGMNSNEAQESALPAQGLQIQDELSKKLVSGVQVEKKEDTDRFVKGPITSEQLTRFVFSRVPENKRVLCLIVRDKMSRLNKAKSYFYPTYYLFIQAIVDIDEITSQEQGSNQPPTIMSKENDNENITVEAFTSADNSFSASSSISADMLFIGANGNGANLSSMKVLSGNSYSDNEVYAGTETEEDNPTSGKTSNNLPNEVRVKSGLLMKSAGSLQGRDSPLVYPNRDNNITSCDISDSGSLIDAWSAVSKDRVNTSSDKHSAISNTATTLCQSSGMVTSHSRINRMSSGCKGGPLKSVVNESRLIKEGVVMKTAGKLSIDDSNEDGDDMDDDDDDDDSDNDESNRKRWINSVNSSRAGNKNEDGEEVDHNTITTTTITTGSNNDHENVQQNLFNDERNPYTGTYGVLLAGRRRKKAKTYIIGLNEYGYTRKNSICKLKSNVLGTQFNAIRLNPADNNDRCNVASISYIPVLQLIDRKLFIHHIRQLTIAQKFRLDAQETNVLGFKGPRKMRVFLTKDSGKESKNLTETFKKNPAAVVQLKNMTPSWNVESQSYVLNFHGRVTQASVKNFQLIESEIDCFGDAGGQKGPIPKDVVASSSAAHNYDQQQQQKDEEDRFKVDSDVSQQHRQSTKNSTPYQRNRQRLEDGVTVNSAALPNSGPDNSQLVDKNHTYNSSIVMQFGRISNHEFTCDVTYPLSILQAFAIALSSFDSKLACE